MKKTFIMALIAAMALSVTGCSGGADESAQNVTAAEEASEAATDIDIAASSIGTESEEEDGTEESKDMAAEDEADQEAGVPESGTSDGSASVASSGASGTDSTSEASKASGSTSSGAASSSASDQTTGTTGGNKTSGSSSSGTGSTNTAGNSGSSSADTSAGSGAAQSTGTASQTEPAASGSSSGGETAVPHTHFYLPVFEEQEVWVVDQAAYDEPIYGERIIASTGEDITDLWDQGIWYDENNVMHDPFGSYLIKNNCSYSVKWVQVDTVHHDEVGHYETQQVCVGNVCSCGATK